MSRACRLQIMCLALCMLHARVLAEGSAELDAADLPANDAHDQAVDTETVLYLDVLDGASEKICYLGNNTPLGVYRPKPEQTRLVASLASGQCTQAVDAVSGAYLLDIESQSMGVPWDIRVCDRALSDAACLADASNAKTGRLYSYDWSFQANSQYIDARSINGSVFAIVPGGAAGHDAVIEMQMRGVSGARYHLRANGRGPETGAGTRIGRSAPRADNQVTAEYPLYLHPPAVAQYNWLRPQIEDVQVTPSCGAGIVPGVAPGSIGFRSNLVGQYVLICDVNEDGIYDLADDADFSAFGTTALGANSARWNGDTKGGAAAAAGSYRCVLRVNVGEFHYIAEDIETAFPGIRMFRLEADRSTRTPLAMYWDDSLVPLDPELMPNAQVSPAAPLAAGLDPGAYADPVTAFAVNGSTPLGNARAWGNFNADGKGNEAFLDQFSAAATAQSAAFPIAVVERTGDEDADGLQNSRECELGSDPQDPDSDGDRVRDGFEATARSAPDTDRDGKPDVVDDDDDGDGRSTVSELGPRENGDGDPEDALDTDRDGKPDYLDTDSDDDGVPDASDAAPLDPMRCRDLDADGCDDCARTAADRSGGDPRNDGPDADGDGRCEQPSTPELDLDRDDDGIPDQAEGEGDADGDGAPNALDLDSDADGLTDLSEAGGGELDADGDGRIDAPIDASPRDGLHDPLELPGGALPLPDTDGDAAPDFLDADDDGDARATRDERADAETFSDIGPDADGDGRPNWLETDSDDDGLDDALENEGDGDASHDGIPDYLQPAVPPRDGSGEPGTLAPNQAQPPRGTLAGGALCAVRAPGSTSAAGGCSFVLLLGILAWRVRRAGWLVLLGLLVCSSPLQAQVALSPFKPAPLAGDGFGLGRPAGLPHLSAGALLLVDYANDPLVFELSGNPQQLRVVQHHLQLHAALALGLWQRLTLFAQLPVQLVMRGPEPLSAPVPPADGAGLGDVALGGRVALLGGPSRFALSGELIARLPTARLANGDEHYSGDAIGSYEPALLAELRLGRLALYARAGARLRKLTRVGNLALDHELVYGGGAALRVLEPLQLHAELYGSTFLKRPWQRVHAPLEALLGLKLQSGDFIVGVAAGPGLSHGFGAPDVRIVGLLGYAPRPRPPAVIVDSDHDGILDPTDRCPREPEDRDAYEDEDGCPDPDNDRDGVLDLADACPLNPEDRDAFEDADGCPDPDNDADGVLDPADRCPSDAEDRDGFEDEDGCPDHDNDRDGMPDPTDKCPDQPEDLDGFEDEDGCPEEGRGLVQLTCEKIEIREAVYFDTGSDHIQERSFGLLDQVASVLAHASYVKRVRVEGHTDNRGTAEYNLSLSQRRAASVLRYLTEHGTAPERLESEGYGLGKPIADNQTEAGRAQNRRVEFLVIDQDSQSCR